MANYTKTMSRLQDEDLFRIAKAEPHADYEPEAIMAAQYEIDRRGISEQTKRDVEFQVAQERAEEIGRPQAELSNIEMICFLLFGPLLIISIPFALILVAKGRIKKARGAFGAIWLSFGLYGLLALAIAFLPPLFSS